MAKIKVWHFKKYTNGGELMQSVLFKNDLFILCFQKDHD